MTDAPERKPRRRRRQTEPLSEVGYYRLTVEQLETIEQAADLAEQPLARWVRLALVREAKRQLRQQAAQNGA